VTRLTLVGGTVFTGAFGAGEPSERSVVVEDGVIVDVTDGTDGPGVQLDCRGKLVLPGFVNAHAHTTEVLFRGLGGTLDHVDWVDRKHRLQRAVDVRGAEAGTRLACLEMLHSGVVAFLDPEVLRDHLPGVERAAGAAGLKAALAVSFEARHGYGTDGGHHGHHGDAGDHGRHGPGNGRGATAPEVSAGSRQGRVTPWLGPRAMSAMTPELADAIAERAASDGLGITFHCSEDHRDHAAVRADHGLTPTAFAQQHGLLTERSVLAHGVYLEPEDLPLIASSGATVVHCPVSNAKTGKGVAPLRELVAAGINVALGTDGGMCNDTYDMFLELRFAGLVHRAAGRDPGATRPEELLAMATANGARSIGTSGGMIEPGRSADLVVIDLRRIGSWPTHDVVDSLVFSATRHVVETVLVDGEILLEDGHATGVDEAAVLRDAEEMAAAAAESALGADERGTSATLGEGHAHAAAHQTAHPTHHRDHEHAPLEVGG
jgi:5-methylthioadenosine/S-adenosylhomocysteine deaminase